MKKIHLKKTQSGSIPRSVVIGTGTSLLFTLLFSALIAYLISGETISQNVIRFADAPIRVVSVFIGSIIGSTLAGNKKAIVIAICSGIYLLFLICMNIMIFDGRMGGIGFGAISVAIGCLLSTLVTALPKKSVKRHKHRFR